MRLRLVLLSILFFYSSGVFPNSYIEEDRKLSTQISGVIGELNMYDEVFKLLDEKCKTSYQLTKSEFKKLNSVVYEKTGVSYSKFNEIFGEPETLKELTSMAIQPLLENKCNEKQLNFFYSIFSSRYQDAFFKLEKLEKLPVDLTGI